MLDQPLTSKMIAEKDGGIGRIIFNNPARHNAVSLEMWQALAIQAGWLVLTWGAARLMWKRGLGHYQAVGG